MRSKIFLVNTIALSICLLSASKPASARDKNRALKHFQAGNLLVETDNYVAAAKEFESSVDLYPTKNGYFNLANCYMVLHRYRAAIATIKEMKDHFGKKLDDYWLSEIRAFEKKFEQAVGKLEVHVNMDGVEVQVDGKIVGKSPLNVQLLLDAGQHEISVFQKGYETVTRKVSLKPQETTLLHLFLEKGYEASDSGQESEKRPEQRTTHPVLFATDGKKGSKQKPRVGMIVFFSVAGASGISAIVTGVVHLSRVSEMRDKCEENLCEPSLKPDVRTIKNLGTATNVLVGVSAFGIVLGTILAFVEGKDDDSDGGVAFQPLTSPDSLGLSISGKF